LPSQVGNIGNEKAAKSALNKSNSLNTSTIHRSKTYY